MIIARHHSRIPFTPALPVSVLFLLATTAVFSAENHQRPTLDASIASDFRNPPNAYRIIQYELPANRVEKYARYGIGGALAFFYRELYQKGPDGPGQIPAIVDAARAKSLKIWLADDFGYPSGMAGGKIVEQNPALEVRGVAVVKLNGSGSDGGAPVTLELPAWAERFVGAAMYPLVNGKRDVRRARVVPESRISPKNVVVDGIGGDWQLCGFVTVHREGQVKSTAKQFGHTGHYPDLLNPETATRFLALMHEPILARIKDASSKVEGFYMNEPNLMQLHSDAKNDAPMACVSWNAALPEKFREMHGYDLFPVLPALFEGDDLESRRARIHFHQTVAGLLAQNFARRVTTWCEQRGLKSAGHFIFNERLPMHVPCYGDQMKFAAEFSVACGQAGMPHDGQTAAFPFHQVRLMSSLGLWKKHDDVMLLLDPIIQGGGLKRLSPPMRQLLNSANMAFFHGANILSAYFPLDRRETKTEFGAGYTEDEYRFFNDYIGRLGVVLRGARLAAATGIYYPIHSLQAAYLPSRQHWTKMLPSYAGRQQNFEAIENALPGASIEYAIVHPDGIADAEISGDGAMKIGDGELRTLVMPRVEFLPKAVLEKLKTFERAGGAIIWVDAVPKLGVYPAEDAAVAGAFASASPVPVSRIASRVKTPFSPGFDLEITRQGKADNDAFACARFRRDGRRLYLLVNRSGDELSLTASGRTAAAKVRVLDPSTGNVTETALPANLRLLPWRSLLLAQ
ncbi:MAG: hypothetical protein LBK99_08915 [Opitutaceae bacterium]|jgi:hypothetical protein|nr:hypothetical protein [Opitutaceae bacterium]